VVVPVGDLELRMRARVLRCRAYAGNPTDSGKIVFRAGLEFVGLSEEAAAALEAAYGTTAQAEARAAGSAPPRPAGSAKLRVASDDITRQSAKSTGSEG
jgi:hypothetical protein